MLTERLCRGRCKPTLLLSGRDVLQVRDKVSNPALGEDAAEDDVLGGLFNMLACMSCKELLLSGIFTGNDFDFINAGGLSRRLRTRGVDDEEPLSVRAGGGGVVSGA